MKRKRLKAEEPKPRKRLRNVDVDIDTPSRADPTLIKIGPKNAFKPWELRKLSEHAIDKVSPNTWLVVFSGPGYLDLYRAHNKKSAKSVVSMFELRYKRVKVEWLKGEPDAPADYAARGASTTTGGERTLQRKRSNTAKPGRRRLKS